VTTPKKRRRRIVAAKKPRRVVAHAVTSKELRALQRELERRLQPNIVDARPKRSRATPARRTKRQALRWNPDPQDVQKSVAQLVLTLVEFLRKLMERQAIRRMEQKTLTRKEIEAVGIALMKLEATIHEIGERFGLTPEDLHMDLGPLKLM
jgi:hypothetical protein